MFCGEGNLPPPRKQRFGQDCQSAGKLAAAFVPRATLIFPWSVKPATVSLFDAFRQNLRVILTALQARHPPD
jgi:hypothetical protein